MKLFGWEIGKKSATSADINTIFREFAEQLKASTGISVNLNTAFQAVTAMACARVISEGLAQVPLKVFQARSTGGSDVLYDHPLYEVLHNAPNEIQTSYEWREMCGLHLSFAGGAYSFINRVRGDVVELLPYEPNAVEPIKRTDGGLEYKLSLASGEQVIVSASDMLHIRGISWNGFEGLEGIKIAREAIGLAVATERHGSKLFSNGAHPGGILYSDASNLPAETRKAIRESWDDTQTGLTNSHKTAILWGGLKWMSTATANDQAQFLETRAFQVEEVCRAFRVMPIMVGHSDKAATYASAEQMFLAHVVHTLGPWYARVEQAYNKQLITREERAKGIYVKHIVSGLLRGAHKDRAEYYAKALGSGGSQAWMSADEVRALEELNPMGGDAAKLPVATNVPKQGGDDETSAL